MLNSSNKEKSINFKNIPLNFMSIDEIKNELNRMSNDENKIIDGYIMVDRTENRCWKSNAFKKLIGDKMDCDYSYYFVYIKFFADSNKKQFGITVGKSNWWYNDIKFDNDDTKLTAFSRKIINDSSSLQWGDNVIFIKMKSRLNEIKKEKIKNLKQEIEQTQNKIKKGELNKDTSKECIKKISDKLRKLRKEDEMYAYLIETLIGHKFGLFNS